MERTERFYKINNLLNTHRVVTKDKFIEILGVSLSTFKRDLEYLRDRFYAPIVYDRELCGYSYEDNGEGRIEFPGLWLSRDELNKLENLVNEIKHNFNNDDIDVSLLLDRFKKSSY